MCVCTDVSSFLVSSDMEVDEGKSFQLSCTPQGNPLLSVVMWRRASLMSSTDERQVTDSQRVSVATSNASVTLTVAQSITADAGLCLCQFPSGSAVRSDRIRVVIRGEDYLASTTVVC